MRIVLAVALLAAACASPRPAGEEPIVDFKALHPAAILDIRYATENNFTRHRVYPAARCLLRKTVAERLDAAARELEAMGLRVALFDCYRPLSVQKAFWALVPDPRYVADPAKGSIHNRGAAVDMTLADSEGRELEMPTGYDDFTEKAHRGWAGASPEAAKNSALLQRVMEKNGFKGLPTEWWHFDAAGLSYPIADVPFDPGPGR